jgi:hypothetical protein
MVKILWIWVGRDDVGIQHILQVNENENTMFKIKLQIFNFTLILFMFAKLIVVPFTFLNVELW